MRFISQLEGALLDYWVARAQGWIDKGDGWWGYDAPGTIPNLEQYAWRPSSNWAQAGEIIDRERIGVIPMEYESGRHWVASRSGIPYACRGETPIQAAMRLYVGLKFGMLVEEVEGV